MAAGNTVQLTFAGDSKSLERAFANVGTSAKSMAADMDTAEQKASLAARGISSAGDAADASEGKFMGAADVLDGLGSAFGLPTEAATGMMRAFGDLSGGFAALQGLFSSGIDKVGQFASAIIHSSTVTRIWTGIQAAFNAVMALNPAILIGAAIVALGVALVVAYQKSETFRDIVHGALNVVKGAAEGLVNFFTSIPGTISGVGHRLLDVITWPYKTAFTAIARLWNNTVGKLSFEIPSWVPGLGGKGFSMPKLPEFHQGGVVPGAPGQPVPIMAMAGETVIPAGGGVSTGTTVFNINFGVVGDPAAAARQIVGLLKQEQRRSGTLGLN